MPALGVNATWGRQEWSNLLIESLSAESALLRSGATRVIVQGRSAFVPRLLVAPTSAWVAELAELPTDAGSADTIELLPKKLGDVIAVSNEAIADSAVNELDSVGASLVRGLANQLDARAFSTAAATAIAPAGLRAVALPTSSSPDISIEALIRAVGSIEALGGVPDVAFVNPADMTELRLAGTSSAYNGAMSIEGPGLASVAGARLISTNGLPAGVAMVAEARFVLVGVRQDAEVAFSSDHAFSRDAVSARVVARLDWEIADPQAVHVLTT